MSNKTAWAIAAVVLGAIFVFACGPDVLCYASGGEPVGNAFVEWCDVDGDRLLTEDDWRLTW